MPMSTATKARKAADGPASVLAMGTATPPHVFMQHEYPDFYFSVTSSNHMTDLKKKFQRICDRSGIQKRHMYLNEEILRANPSMCDFWGQSLDARQEHMVEEIPRLGGEAALKALDEWGQPKSCITHLVFCSTGGMDLPGADWALTKRLGLRHNVKRLMLYSQGCFGGGTALRMAKDLAENNKGARVLVVCSEITVVTFRGPNETHIDSLVGQALFSDGASALIVGSDPIAHVEKPWFEVHWTGSYILPDSDGAIQGHWKQIGGLTFHLHKTLPQLISKNLGAVLKDALDNAILDDDEHTARETPSPNEIFWITHPGGPAILNQMEETLKLKPEKLAATRQVLSEYGNMSSACVFFIMEQMRRNSLKNKLPTSGEGFEWGVLVSFGPGVTCETILLKSLPLA